MTQIERAEGDASGKVILFGEHAVVYGSPAIAAGIERGAHASATRFVGGPSILRIGDRELVADPSGEDDLSRAFHALLDMSPTLPAMRVEASSGLPAGGGLGSSAALGVAIARAAQALVGADDNLALARSAAWERVFHGNPSGIDATAAARGGIFRYSRIDGASPLHPAKDIVLCVGWTGEPSSTREMVEYVASRKAKEPQLIQRSIDAIATIVNNAALAIEAGEHAALGELMNMNQLVLSGLMVSTSELEDLCAVAREHGALGAKLTGGGGGGSSIALVAPAFTEDGAHDQMREAENADRIVVAWRRANPRYDGFVVRIYADKPAKYSEGEAP